MVLNKIPKELLEKIFYFINDFSAAHNFYLVFPFCRKKL